MNIFKPSLTSSPPHPKIKYITDLLLILVTSPVLIPLYFFITLLIRLQSPGSIHYTTTKMNHRGQPIRTTQFRTFHSSADHLVHEFHQRYAHLHHTLTPDQQAYQPRYTRIGRLLTRTNLHNLPLLLNVITGQMSLVGLTPRFREQPTTQSIITPKTTTGILSLWHLAQHRGSPSHHRYRYDNLYLQNQSLALDLKILFRTITQSLHLFYG
ncbi:UDP-glucose:undecaprenyl-phosphate glucose-1-phosphate transferase [Poriferisphaera corsica]|uniref:UDP-glucose:undecaprenyl-phosphate glucose-1-phosphate transferase n=1 Tax=Poriferisphaera corsica TaxID=2528020 RepID=A0A517YPB1_9BACT|nr:sugar transferase [Poriferisphaera corsica]QDU32042.1 UDP-glucose:undecaprenyl-phosphate glucose-1-phosphate transferase [Poriferisphaera corsica]